MKPPLPSSTTPLPPSSSSSCNCEGEDELERAKRRCVALRDETLESLPSSKISPSAKLTLRRLLTAELRFLSSSSLPSTSSLNLGYLESILRTIRHPSVHQVSRLCKPIPISPSLHVDIVCTFARSPAWFFVSDRNPNYISWSQRLLPRLLRILAAARAAVSLRPSLIFFVFCKGLADDVARSLAAEFGAVEVDLLGIGRTFEIEVEPESGGSAGELRHAEGLPGGELGGGGSEFGGFVSSMRWDGEDIVNFDTTALVGIVSGISNGGCRRLMEASEEEMRGRFKGNYEFVMAQVMSELEHPILAGLRNVIAGKKGIVCESVCSEFKELVLMCGGPNEKLRADLLLKHLLVVQDRPSERVAALPTTRKMASKNKIAFGTGDYWHAPTLTANMGFVRAIAQTGMSLLTIEHRPRALTGD